MMEMKTILPHPLNFFRMIKPKDHVSEEERLLELKSYSILDTLAEEDYDNLTTLAAAICGTAISLISLVDDKRQWFKSHHGIDTQETPKSQAFCAHAIHNENEIFIINDARIDERFWDNPLVVDDPKFIFYAGVPLVNKKGLPLGTLCVIDNKPRVLDEGQIKSLKALSNQVMRLLELRKANKERELYEKELALKNKELTEFAYVAAHDLKTPLQSISGFSNCLSLYYGDKLDEEGNELIKNISILTTQMTSLIKELLDHSTSDQWLITDKFPLSVNQFHADLLATFKYEPTLVLKMISPMNEISVNTTALKQVIINLITNAIKYNDKKVVHIRLTINEEKKRYVFEVEDNGIGISTKNMNKIFNLFTTLKSEDRYGEKGHGIGLATVKKMISKMGGEITVTSTLGEGSTFSFYILK
jgi:signal transduction histidine kinase